MTIYDWYLKVGAEGFGLDAKNVSSMWIFSSLISIHSYMYMYVSLVVV